MFKKIVLCILFFFFMLGINNSFADEKTEKAVQLLNEIKQKSDAKAAEKEKIQKINESVSKRNAECWVSWDCLDKPNFTISTTEMFSFWWKWVEWSTSKEKINNLLNWKLIQNLMIALWVVSLFVMTVWAWYIIAYHWQDEFLSRWKSIFVTWIVSLIIALTSYYMVSLVRYIIFT